jgi:pyridoxal phosphate enzyme (YggS family)
MIDIIQECIKAHRDSKEVQLLAVTKGRSVEEIGVLYERGMRDFCENRVQEAQEKMMLLPKDIRWHFIGTLQTKKIPKVIGRYFRIHSVDTLALAKVLSQKSKAAGVVTDILIQVHTSGESTKHGVSCDELVELFDSFIALPNIRVRGLMTMAASLDLASEDEVRGCFRKLHTLFELLKKGHEGLLYFSELSMGMSQDYRIAISEGATMLRIGTALFTHN